MRQERMVKVERIFIVPARGADQVECERVTVKRGIGIQGDRNFVKSAHPGQNLTLVEAEEFEMFFTEHSRAANLSLTRRNLVT